MTPQSSILIRANRYGEKDRQVRAPELNCLASRSVGVFGLGCVGAPSAMELARAGVSRLWLVDRDMVDPATALRWPLGITAAGIPKSHALAEFIHSNYP